MEKQSNWLIFHKFDETIPIEFVELIWHGNALIHRRGKIMTFGSSNRESFSDADSLNTEVNERCTSIEQEGFTLIRKFDFNPSYFDFDLLRQEIEIATKLAFIYQRNRTPGVNAFAILTDSDAMTIGILAHAFESIAEADDDLLWIPDEWTLEDGEEYYFDIPYRLILSQHRDDLTQVNFSDYQLGFTESVISALENLDRNEFFGTQTERENMVLAYHVSDDDQNLNAYQRLNTPAMFKRFKKWWKSWN